MTSGMYRNPLADMFKDAVTTNSDDEPVLWHGFQVTLLRGQRCGILFEEIRQAREILRRLG